MKHQELHNFIYFMVHNKNLTRQQKTSRDRLLESPFMPNEEVSMNSSKKELFSLLSPYETFQFLSGFQEPMMLKYLTHDFDYGFNDERPVNWSELLNQIESLWKEEKKLKRLPKTMWHLFNNFIYGKEVWLDMYGMEHKSSIKNKEWLDWCSKNNEHPLKNREFEKEIRAFSSATRIRSDLPSLIDKISRETGIKINSKKLHAADFYTNTLIVYRALKRIIEGTMKPYYDKYPEINIEFSRVQLGENRFHEISITQVGSFPQKSLKEAVERLQNFESSGDFGYLRGLLNGYCLWSIETNWEDGPKRWNILREPKSRISEIEEIEEDSIVGFRHKLKFYQS